MIELTHVTKNFNDIVAVNDVSVKISENNVFGMIGTNGAGKSTILRMITGVYKQDSGEILVDGSEVYDNTQIKSLFFFIPDEPYFFANSTPKEMAHYYAYVYPNFNRSMFDEYLKHFELSPSRKINTFSKGMKKQLALLLGICSETKYLICDETFDGLDPVMRQGIKSIFASQMEERGLTPIIASHNLRELEDICDHVGLLHKGGVLLAKDLEDMKCNIQKVQCVFGDETAKQTVLSKLDVMKIDQRGALVTITARGNREEIINLFASVDVVFVEVLPLTLEEIFISETEVIGYDIKKLILS